LILDHRLCPDMTSSYHTTAGAGNSALLPPVHGVPQPGVAARGGRVQAVG
jgi:hypothetical protein